jgi:hypothetical protein
VLINVFYGKYYNEQCQIIDIPEDKVIITNNSDSFTQVDNILDLRILKWLIDSSYSPFKDKADVKDPVSMKKYVLEEKELVRDSVNLLEDTFKYTRIYKIINKNHQFQYNKNFLLQLKEQIKINSSLKNRVPELEMEKLDEINSLEKGIVYDFINPTGKIMGKGFNLSKMDRKKHIKLFKTDEDSYAIIDFKSFEPYMINYYIPNFINENFYETNCKTFGIDREEFKVKFVGWINGAGRPSLGVHYGKFEEIFPEITQLRNKLTTSNFKNVFGRVVTCSEKYKRLGYLIQSTGGDLLKELHVKLYEEKNKQFKLIWSLFDEFLVKGDISQFCELVKKWYPNLDVKVTNV